MQSIVMAILAKPTSAGKALKQYVSVVAVFYITWLMLYLGLPIGSKCPQ